MSKRIYNKPPKTFQEQLQQLKDRNLTVEGDVKALSILTNISYYRFLSLPEMYLVCVLFLKIRNCEVV